MRVIVGIGNSGARYRETRHNIGFLVVERLADRFGVALRSRKFHSLVGELRRDADSIILAKPQTYVNESGRAVRAILDFYKCPADSLIAVCDDFNLPLGTLRVRSRGSSGGHGALKSIGAQLSSFEFPRLRIGIGAVLGEDAVDHVLGRFSPEERSIIHEAAGRAVEALVVWLDQGIEACMNAFN